MSLLVFETPLAWDESKDGIDEAQRAPSMTMPVPTLTRTQPGLAGVVLLAMLIAAPFALRAQETTFRRLTGIVTDAGHEPLAGAVVELHNDETEAVTSCITNRTGRYRFPRFPSGDNYHVSARFHGHESRSKSLSKFDAKSNRTIHLVVKLH